MLIHLVNNSIIYFISLCKMVTAGKKKSTFYNVKRKEIILLDKNAKIVRFDFLKKAEIHRTQFFDFEVEHHMGTIIINCK